MIALSKLLADTARQRQAGEGEPPHKCPLCGEPNPDYLDLDGCRDPDCPEQRG